MRLGLGFGLGAGQGAVRPLTTKTVLLGRGQISTTSATVATNTTSKRGHWVYSDGGVVNFKCIDTKWFMGTNPTAGGSNTIKRYIEFPVGSGTFYQVTWAASTTLSRASGGTYTSDAVAGLVLPRGWQYFEERTTATSGGTLFPQIEMPAGSTVLGLPDGNDLTDKSHSGSIAATSGVVTFGAAAWIGDVTGYAPRGKLILGDSIAFGQGDVSSVSAHYASGWMARACEARTIGYSKMTKPGQQAADFVAVTASITPFLAALPATTEIDCEFGVNDLRLGRTKAQLEADLQTIYTMVAGKGNIRQTTITPRSTSTDSWATVANQTADTDGTMASLNPLNADIRAGLAQTHAHIDAADAFMSARDSDVWGVIGGVAPTLDGTHPISVYAVAYALALAGAL